MKKYLFIAAGLLSLLASCSQKNPNQVSLAGTTDLADGEIIMLYHQSGDSMIVDTVSVSNGSFTFTTEVEGATMANLLHGEPAMNNKQSRRFFLEPGDMTITINGDDYSEAPVTGSKATSEMDDIECRTRAIYTRITQLHDSVTKYQDQEEIRAGFSREFDSLRNIVPGIQKAWIKENPGAVYGSTLMLYLMGNMDYPEIKEIYESWTPEVQASASEVKQELDALAAIQPGQPAPDITGDDPQGNPIKLSDLKGHVVLLDFWATWCGPCRASFPHINALYEKYKDKGFQVFMVADNDSDPDNWREYILNDKVDAYHHVLRGLKIKKDAEGNFNGYDQSNDQSAKYAVHYLPTKFLIDADGKIIGKVDDEQLDAKLKEIYGE